MRTMQRAALKALAAIVLTLTAVGLVQSPAAAAVASPVTLQILISGPNANANHVIMAINRPGKSSDYPCLPVTHGARTSLELDLPVGTWIKVFPADGCYAPVAEGKDFVISRLNEVIQVDLTA